MTLRCYLAGLLTALCPLLPAQITCNGPTAFTILHYTQTAGFDHGTRSQSNQMFVEIGQQRNFTVVNSQDRASFDDLQTLLGYEVIVFANTSGDIPFSQQQRDNLENYVAAGGAVLGIHAATDMYRGNQSYPFYTDLMGGSRRNSPAHTSRTHNNVMDLIGTHASTANLPNPYPKQEEYYYWPDTGLVSNITEVLRVRATGGNSYDAARPISWYQEFPSGARSFYTGLGHDRSNYTDATAPFRTHLADALCWCVEAAASNLPVEIRDVRATHVDKRDVIRYVTGGEPPVRIDVLGRAGGGDETLLETLRAPAFSGAVARTPADVTVWRHYRLRFYDAAGVPTHSPWVSVAPQITGGQVRYGPDGVVIYWPGAERPEGVVLFNAAGRRVGRLLLTGERTVVPVLPAGTYFARSGVGQVGLRFVVR